MSRTVYSFAGCIMEGAPFLTPFVPGGQRSTLGMSTEGVLRILGNETLAIEPEQLELLRSDDPGRPVDFGVYGGLRASMIDAILWTPVSDAVYLTPLARCQNKSVYPIHDARINSVLGTTGASLSLAAIGALWSQFFEQTQEISQRAIVFYPTDHLTARPWKERIDMLQDWAGNLFHGWHHFTPKAELAMDDGYWAHYSDDARLRLWAEVEDWLT